MSEKTIINWTGGGTLQTWTNGEWQILYAKDSAGNCVTLSLTSHDAVRLAYAVSPVPNEQFERLREANSAVQELSYPEARSDELRQVADVIDCGGGCGRCGSQSLDRGEFCDFVAAENLRKLAAALDLKAKIDASTPSRPDAGGGVRDILRDVVDNGLIYWEPRTERGHVQKALMLARCEKALSTPPAAAESNARVEARLRELLCTIRSMHGELGAKLDDISKYMPNDHVAQAAARSRQKGLGLAILKALSEVGDEAKKSEGGQPHPSHDIRGLDQSIFCTECNGVDAELNAPGPSSPTAERREIVVRALRSLKEITPKGFANYHNLIDEALSGLAALDGGAGG